MHKGHWPRTMIMLGSGPHDSLMKGVCSAMLCSCCAVLCMRYVLFPAWSWNLQQ